MIVATLEVFLHSWREKLDLLADWTILLAGDDGKVAADGPEAGEDLGARGEEVEIFQTSRSSFQAEGAATTGVTFQCGTTW